VPHPRITALCSKQDLLLASDKQRFELSIHARMLLHSRELKTWVRLVTPSVKRALADAEQHLPDTNHAHQISSCACVHSCYLCIHASSSVAFLFTSGLLVWHMLLFPWCHDVFKKPPMTFETSTRLEQSKNNFELPKNSLKLEAW
jgi:hypothetical protein